MEIFKLYEATIADVQPGHINTKELRRDQLLDNYDAATRTLHDLIKAKNNEIAYRRDLIDMLEKSKAIYDVKLKRVTETYQTAKKHAPESLDLKIGSIKKPDGDSRSNPSTTPPLPAPSAPIPIVTTNPNPTSSQSSQRASEFDIPLPTESIESRSSLDRRLSEFMKTFPNLTATSTPSSNNSTVKPMPGYYTQQPPPPPLSITATTPPMMAMMRFPPPPLPPSNTHHNVQNHINHENHDTTDMDLSDYDESTNNGTSSTTVPTIPMVASAMQQGAGGKQHLRTPDLQQPNYVSGQHFNSAVQYTPRLNPLPFDPSIMEPRLRDSSSTSSGGRDLHDRGGHRHSSSSGGSSSGGKISSEKNKYSSSSHSSSRSKRR